MRHHLVERLAQAQAELSASRTIDARDAFVRRRVLAQSHARGRRVIAWAISQRQAHEPCFCALMEAIEHGRPVALLLMACWADHPECQEVA